MKWGNSSSCKYWWYNNQNTSSTNDDTNSISWSTANGLRRFTTYCSNKIADDTYSYYEGKYNGRAKKGDLVFFDFDATLPHYSNHSMIITKVKTHWWYGYKKIYVSGHTTDRKDYYMEYYNLDNYHLIFADI